MSRYASIVLIPMFFVGCKTTQLNSETREIGTDLTKEEGDTRQGYYYGYGDDQLIHRGICKPKVVPVKANCLTGWESNKVRPETFASSLKEQISSELKLAEEQLVAVADAIKAMEDGIGRDKLPSDADIFGYNYGEYDVAVPLTTIVVPVGERVNNDEDDLAYQYRVLKRQHKQFEDAIPSLKSELEVLPKVLEALKKSFPYILTQPSPAPEGLGYPALTQTVGAVGEWSFPQYRPVVARFARLFESLPQINDGFTYENEDLFEITGHSQLTFKFTGENISLSGSSDYAILDSGSLKAAKSPTDSSIKDHYLAFSPGFRGEAVDIQTGDEIRVPAVNLASIIHKGNILGMESKVYRDNKNVGRVIVWFKRLEQGLTKDLFEKLLGAQFEYFFETKANPSYTY